VGAPGLTEARSFGSPYRHGFARVAAAVPALAVTDVAANAAATIDLLGQAHERDVAVVVFPELGLTGYSAQDLFHQQAFVEAALDGLDGVRAATEGTLPVAVAGLPLRVGHQLFNVAAVLHDGEILGIVPKSYLPNYREFYEKRHFSAARDARADAVTVLGREVPFGTGLLFEAQDVADLVVGVEICEDLWAPLPPSTFLAMAGATVLLNPSGSNITIGKDAYRRSLCATHSAQTISAYVYAAAGSGESTTDLAWDGHALICENGGILAESERHATAPQLVVRDVDLDRLVADRIRTTSYTDAATDHAAATDVRRVRFTLGVPDRASELEREVPRFPFVPTDGPDRDDRCAEVYAIQTSGLVTRLRATGIDKVVVGVSGGLDSTQALLVAARSMDLLGLPRANVLGVTMPGFATSTRTLSDAQALMAALGVGADTIDIRPAAQQMLEDLGHPAATGAPVYDVTYENVQAGARTSLLFRLANQRGALVVGTGDLSELALGWCTYGVGDQMSHYGVNASVPKTLVKDLVRWVARSDSFEDGTAEVLESILATGISPELVPGAPGDDPDAGPHQRSEDVVGPYDLQDFHQYHVLRFGYRPSKVAFLAQHAWGDRTRGAWPTSVADADRHEYDGAEVLRWLREFLVRFFQTSQFKRSAMPDGPKVGSGGSLSPRGDWRAPSDGSAAVWLAELDALADELGVELV
jgi:NAD+ synthase (glutamine-hydrolysing)